MDNWNLFSNLININFNEEKKLKLIKYCDILLDENKKYNLTAITEVQDVILKHFYDSVLFTNYKNITNQYVCDIGTGPGFPGIVLKILFPETKIILLDSNNKKINFLNKVINELKLSNIEAVNKRAEDFVIGNIEKFDIVVSRAVAPLNILIELGAALLKIGGDFICLKGKNANLEIKDLNKKEVLLGLKIYNQQILEIDNLGTRNNIFFKKINKTSKEYPRIYSKIKKNPIGSF